MLTLVANLNALATALVSAMRIKCGAIHSFTLSGLARLSDFLGEGVSEVPPCERSWLTGRFRRQTGLVWLGSQRGEPRCNGRDIAP